MSSTQGDGPLKIHTDISSYGYDLFQLIAFEYSTIISKGYSNMFPLPQVAIIRENTQRSHSLWIYSTVPGTGKDVNAKVNYRISISSMKSSMKFTGNNTCDQPSSFQIESSVYNLIAYSSSEHPVHSTQNHLLISNKILDANNLYRVVYILYYTFYTRLRTAYGNMVIYSGVHFTFTLDIVIHS